MEKVNHPAVTKAAANITQLAHVSWPSGTVPNMTTIAATIEREAKYLRLIEAATKVLRSEFSSNHREWREVIAELRSVLAEIKEG